MRCHIHIPTLHLLALYVACDNITLHGRQGLPRQIPYALYLRCISTFYEKTHDRMSIKTLYDILRQGNELASVLPGRWLMVAACSLLDHVDLSSDIDVSALSKIIARIMDVSDDADVVIECLHRFAARCTELCQHQIMVEVMSHGLALAPCKSIRDLLIHYGARLDPNDVMKAIECGMSDVVQRAIDNHHRFTDLDMIIALRSGDLETIKLVSHALGDRGYAKVSSYLCIRDFDLALCENLLSLNILRRKAQYPLHDACSVAVIKWFIDHSMVDTYETLDDVVTNATGRGGQYVNVLHYLVEEAHIDLPSYLLVLMSESHTVDLGVFDYVLSHGIGVNEFDADGNTVAINHPLLLRYWIDNGIKIDDVTEYVWQTVMTMFEGGTNDDDMLYAMSVLSLLSTMFHVDINHIYKDGRTLLHHADSYKHIMTMVACGAHANARDSEGNNPLHIQVGPEQTDDRELHIVTLIAAGADANAVNNEGQTPLHVACMANQLQTVDFLTQLNVEFNTDLNIIDNNGRTPYECTSTVRSDRYCGREGTFQGVSAWYW